MANYIEVTKTSPLRFVPASSRYADSTVIYYTEKNLIAFEIYKRTDRKTSKDDKFMVISKGLEYRPDLVSFRAYGVPDYWWKIMQINGMKDIMEFSAGTNIRIPDNIFF